MHITLTKMKKIKQAYKKIIMQKHKMFYPFLLIICSFMDHWQDF